MGLIVVVIGNMCPNHSLLPLVVVLTLISGDASQAAQNTFVNPSLIEVLTTTDLPVVGESVTESLSESGKVNIQVYELDSIQRVEADLSRGLSADPHESRRVALERFQRLREEDLRRIQNAAIGLTKAAQYRVDRYPAIVFDGEVVVYGIPDVRLALFQYQQWLEGQKP